MTVQDTLFITIAKDHDFTKNIKDILENKHSVYGNFANSPARDYDYVACMWGHIIYFFEKYNSEEIGIGFKTLTDIVLTTSKGFRFFQYKNKEEMLKDPSNVALF